MNDVSFCLLEIVDTHWFPIRGACQSPLLVWKQMGVHSCPEIVDTHRFPIPGACESPLLVWKQMGVHSCPQYGSAHRASFPSL